MKAFILAVVFACGFAAGSEDERLPNKCEVCKILTTELQEALEKTGRSKEVLEVGEVLDTGKRRRKIRYNTSGSSFLPITKPACLTSLFSLDVSFMDVLLPPHSVEEDTGNHRLVELLEQLIADFQRPQSPQEVHPAPSLPVQLVGECLTSPVYYPATPKGICMNPQLPPQPPPVVRA
ncbi:protein canopy 4 isoform X2 [Cyprinodon tularosa]|uniref:protein canopy 4 isoform X2 n=1 Tax=Cyprinodon tularosa TaxID=77115 RepID=UPI0018E2606D|nr:protein canopy 4 isoform X2 [Cyprinodon tularosa]